MNTSHSAHSNHASGHAQHDCCGEADAPAAHAGHARGGGWRGAASVTLHCLTGCSIGELAGIAIGVGRGWAPRRSVGVAGGLSFISGYALTLIPMLRRGFGLAAAFRTVWLGEAISIGVMELVMNLVDYQMGGMRGVSLASARYWEGRLRRGPGRRLPGGLAGEPLDAGPRHEALPLRTAMTAAAPAFTPHFTRHFTIGRLARLAGVSIDTVRFYERQGLLAPAPRSSGGYRQYSAADAERLKFVRRAKDLGFSLEDIAELLRLARDGQDRSRVKAIAACRVADLERRIRELDAMRSVLAHHLRHCSGRGSVQGCPIIGALSADSAGA